MRILILNSGDDLCLGASYERAFQEIGHDVRRIDPSALLQEYWMWRHRLPRRIFEKQLLSTFNRNWLPGLAQEETDLIWVGKGDWALPQFWNGLKQLRPNLPILCYNADNPITTFSRGSNRPWVTRSIGCFDLFCTYSQSLLDKLKIAGAAHPFFIPFAWDPWIHPMPDETESEYDLTFIGNGDAHREKWLTEILNAAKGRDWKVVVFGNWRPVQSSLLQAAIRAHQVTGKEMAAVISKSKVTLNILRLQNEGSHNMRTFEIPGCGGLMASQYSSEQNQLFPDGGAAIYFKTAAEAVDRIQAAIDNPAQLASMKGRARQIIMRHTYVDRARSIMNEIESTEQSNR